MPRLHLIRVPLLALVAALIGGCGAIISTSELTDATRAVEHADELGAERLAVYEFVSAEEYLDKAREEWGRSDYQMAIDYARRARDFAEAAVARVNRGTPRPGTDEPSPREGSHAPQR